MAAEWFHVAFSTYGVWLPGDPRGFRSRGGRIKSVGYNPWGEDGNPEHDGLWHFAQKSMRRKAVVLTQEQQRAALAALVSKVREADMEVICIAVCAVHTHLLGRFEVESAKRQIGRLKRHSALALREEIPGGVWGERCHPRRIKSRALQVNAFKYILDHARKEKASVWSFRDAPSATARRSAGFAGGTGSSRA